MLPRDPSSAMMAFHAGCSLRPRTRSPPAAVPAPGSPASGGPAASVPAASPGGTSTTCCETPSASRPASPAAAAPVAPGESAIPICTPSNAFHSDEGLSFQTPYPVGFRPGSGMHALPELRKVHVDWELLAMPEHEQDRERRARLEELCNSLRDCVYAANHWKEMVDTLVRLGEVKSKLSGMQDRRLQLFDVISAHQSATQEAYRSISRQLSGALAGAQAREARLRGELSEARGQLQRQRKCPRAAPRQQCGAPAPEQQLAAEQQREAKQRAEAEASERRAAAQAAAARADALAEELGQAKLQLKEARQRIDQQKCELAAAKQAEALVHNAPRKRKESQLARELEGAAAQQRLLEQELGVARAAQADAGHRELAVAERLGRTDAHRLEHRERLGIVHRALVEHRRLCADAARRASPPPTSESGTSGGPTPSIPAAPARRPPAGDPPQPARQPPKQTASGRRAPQRRPVPVPPPSIPAPAPAVASPAAPAVAKTVAPAVAPPVAPTRAAKARSTARPDATALRVDAADGMAYTFADFEAEYGEQARERWARSRVVSPDQVICASPRATLAPVPQGAAQAPAPPGGCPAPPLAPGAAWAALLRQHLCEKAVHPQRAGQLAGAFETLCQGHGFASPLDAVRSLAADGGLTDALNSALTAAGAPRAKWMEAAKIRSFCS
eukprot:TRINITY_DN10280_c0_g1_i1.p1 TRINITY_DN10280_c0_g1~~TRINITY_DN10280_c0_g1_i1.p1  ORF type:complete len:711 (+),score=184.17 TRINITY_DN10280_c0_g1_i1:111-2135(+)